MWIDPPLLGLEASEMKMCRHKLLAALASFLAVFAVAGAGDNGKPAKSAGKPDYTDFSRLLQKLAVSKIPKMHEDTSGWGQTVPIPEKLRLPGLRKMVRVGNRMELPHGLWRKVKVWMKDPAKDLRITVRDVKQINPKTMRLSLEADATFGTAVQAQLWQKGLALPGFAGQADATIGVLLDCDVAIEVVAKKFPPELKVIPKVADIKTELKEFNLREVSTLRLGKVLEGERAKEVGNQYKGILQDMMHSAEPMVKDYANEAIAKSIQEGKGTLSADALFKLMSAAPVNGKKTPDTSTPSKSR
jgi:hypothetical protein